MRSGGRLLRGGVGGAWEKQLRGTGERSLSLTCAPFSHQAHAKTLWGEKSFSNQSCTFTGSKRRMGSLQRRLMDAVQNIMNSPSSKALSARNSFFSVHPAKFPTHFHRSHLTSTGSVLTLMITLKDTVALEINKRCRNGVVRVSDGVYTCVYPCGPSAQLHEEKCALESVVQENPPPCFQLPLQMFVFSSSG